MSTMKINGKIVQYSGSGSINISGGKVTVGGVDISDLDSIDQKEITIVIEGNVENLSTDYGDITVKGKANSVLSKNGNITCGEVSGDVETKNGNVSCGKVSGEVSTKNGNIFKG